MIAGPPVSLFPLPNVLLYPDAMLPLHVFEPRYLSMVEDLLERGEERIVVGLLAPGWEDRYFERPAVHAIAGLGKVLQARKTENGRYNLLVQGVQRVRILEELPPEKPYRSVRFEEVAEQPPTDPKECAHLQEALRNGLIEFADGSLILQANASVGYMADLLTVALPIPVELKQELFSTLEVCQRARSVLRLVEDALTRRRTLKEAARKGDRARWN